MKLNLSLDFSNNSSQSPKFNSVFAKSLSCIFPELLSFSLLAIVWQKHIVSMNFSETMNGWLLLTAFLLRLFNKKIDPLTFLD